MSADMRQLIAGNWKMNGLNASRGELEAMIAGLPQTTNRPDVVICPPATLIADFARAAAGRVGIGGQDCHQAEKGAFTGDISASMLRDAGASHVIIGHSERRQYHGENDAVIGLKLKAAIGENLQPILCIGESLAEREAGQTLTVLARQLTGALGVMQISAMLSVAYEPIWAIGTGKTPTLQEIEATHAHIRRHLSTLITSGKTTRILYGGSVNPGNAADILALGDVDGALVGGASLKAADFLAIIAAARC